MSNTRELHYRYLISYLVSAIVLLVALRYFDVENLVDKLSFALTISSLILAVMAIFFSVVSAQKQESQLGKLLETNAQLEAAGREVSTAATEIRSFAHEAPKHFRAIDSKLESVSENFLSIKTMEVLQEAVPRGGASLVAFDEKQFRELYAKLHFLAMMVLYLFERSIANNRSIERETFEKLDFISFEYAVGVLTVLESVGLVSFQIHSGAIVPATCADVVHSQISGILEKVISVVKDDQKDRLRKIKGAVDAHIAS